jgi:hypothetical protein
MVKEVIKLSKKVSQAWYAPEPLWARLTRRLIFIAGVVNEAGLIDFYHLLVGAGVELPKQALVVLLGIGYFATKFTKVTKEPTIKEDLTHNIQPNEDGSNLN